MELALEKIERMSIEIEDRGQVADYIPALASVNPKKFGLCVLLANGNEYCLGEADVHFSIQSVSKVFSLAVALGRSGSELWTRVGKEPTGRAFNSLSFLESENGRPRNPFINAGALVVTDEVLAKRTPEQALAEILSFVRTASEDNSIYFNDVIARSEQDCGQRNLAIANFLSGFGNLKADADAATWTYFCQCAIEMTARQLARSGRFLAFPSQSTRLLSDDHVNGILAIMMTCGHYDGSGNFAFRVGFPAKSGVGGGILGIVPGVASIAVWGPGLDVYGNSLVGTRALEILSKTLDWSVFRSDAQQPL